jgi:hypothetical protein
MHRLQGVILGVIAVASISTNIGMAYRVRRLEERLWLTSIRFDEFVKTTSRVIQKARVTEANLEAAEALGLPRRSGRGYVENLDPHYGFGIRYFVGLGGEVVGWTELPELDLVVLDGRGRPGPISPHQLARREDPLKIP